MQLQTYSTGDFQSLSSHEMPKWADKKGRIALTSSRNSTHTKKVVEEIRDEVVFM